MNFIGGEETEFLLCENSLSQNLHLLDSHADTSKPKNRLDKLFLFQDVTYRV